MNDLGKFASKVGVFFTRNFVTEGTKIMFLAPQKFICNQSWNFSSGYDQASERSIKGMKNNHITTHNYQWKNILWFPAWLTLPRNRPIAWRMNVLGKYAQSIITWMSREKYALSTIARMNEWMSWENMPNPQQPCIIKLFWGWD